MNEYRGLEINGHDYVVVEDVGSGIRARMRDDVLAGRGHSRTQAIEVLVLQLRKLASDIENALAAEQADIIPDGLCFDDYPKKKKGKGNPYYACELCGITDPAINGRLDGHRSDCAYRIFKTETLFARLETADEPQ